MEDYLFLGVNCLHRIRDEIIYISGLSPNFYFYTQFDINKNISPNITFIRDYNTTVGLTSIYPVINGITNFYFSLTDTKLVFFGNYPVDAGMNYPNPNIAHIPSDVYLIDYNTLIGDCPLCGSTGIINDIVYEPSGDIAVITGTTKLKQTVLKALLTTIGSNQFDPLYGSGLNNLVGQTLDTYTSIRLQQYIQDCVSHLMDIQSKLTLTPEETILRINDIAVSLDSADSTKINILIVITDGTGTDVQLNLTMVL